MTANDEINAEVAFGEAFGASLLLGMLLGKLVQKGLCTHPEISALTDRALLTVEQLRGHPGMPVQALDRARAVLEQTLKPFSDPHQKPGARS